MYTVDKKVVRILAVDDYAVMRGVIRKLFFELGEEQLKSLPAMELCGVAQDGVEALEAITRLRPDVLLLDLEMPRLNGLQVLEQLRLAGSDLPVIMCSAHTGTGARLTLSALALGAMDYVMKPTRQSNPKAALEALANQLLPRIALAARAHPRTNVSADPSKEPSCSVHSHEIQPQVEAIVIGVSTGGPTALEQILPRLPSSLSVPILIAQHMPKLFTQALADRLDRCCPLPVRQAYEGAVLAPGTVWIAPGGSDMTLAKKHDLRVGGAGPANVTVRLQQQGDQDHCTPSVDALFRSASRVFGDGTLAYVLTGMGEDGLVGAREIHSVGGTVIAQDEQTSAVWGMPARIIQSGIAAAMLPLGGIAGDLVRRTGHSSESNGPAKKWLSQAAVLQPEVLYGV